VLKPLKRALGPGLDTLQGVPNVCLETYFDIHVLGKQKNGETKSQVFIDGEGYWTLTPNVLMPTDIHSVLPTQLRSHYKRANVIYMDCETSSFPSGVHPYLADLINKMDEEVQKKCLLYHYESYPEVPKDMTQ